MKVEPTTIIWTVAEYFRIQESELKLKDRRIRVVKAKHIAMFYCRQFTELIFREIGELFNCSHASVIHAIKSVNNQYETNAYYRDDVNNILDLLKERSHIDEWSSGEDIFMENDFFPLLNYNL